jgi:RNA recognition motif-containing protein
VNKKLYVGNLPYTATTDQLREHFSQAGTVVDAVVIIDGRTNRSKGFGFVEFEKEEDAGKAITMFGGKDFGGRNLVVNEARPKAEEGGEAPAKAEAAPKAEAPKEEEATEEEKPEEVKEEKKAE